MPVPLVTRTLEIGDELAERLDGHRDEGQSREEFVGELVSIDETGGTFVREGYSE